MAETQTIAGNGPIQSGGVVRAAGPMMWIPAGVVPPLVEFILTVFLSQLRVF